jgi:nucleotide-binding universal stress UspA family protein
METAMYKHILIPTDGSDLAGKGVKQGLALAKALGAKVTAVTATEPFPISGLAIGAGWVPSEADMQDFNAAQKEGADKILAAVKAEAAKVGVEVDLVHAPGERAAEAILDAATTRKVDLIVIASHGRRGVERVLLGSQTAEVLAHSSIPVLVVK